MSRKQAQLIQGLRQLNKSAATIIPGIVEDTYPDKGTVDVSIAEGIVIEQVRLRAVIGDDLGAVVLPAKKTSVLIARINDSDNYVVVSTEEAEKIKYRIGDLYLDFDNKGLQVSNGNDSLKKCLDDLLDEIVTIYAPMNKAAFMEIKQRLTKLLK